jgi:AraC-like DNA-binding protein
MADLIFLAASRSDRSEQRIDKYLRGYATVQFMESGRVLLAYDEREQVLEGAWFWPAHPGPRIRFHPARAGEFWSHRHVGFQGPLVEEWMAQGLWPRQAQAAPASKTPAQWGEEVDEIARLSQQQGPWSRRAAVNRLERLLLDLAQARQDQETQDPFLQQVLALLEGDEKGAAWPDYASVARALGVSQATLRRRFRVATGTSPHDYVVRSRIARARVLLSESEAPLKEVASRLGYADVAFFARQFRQVAGVAPGAFRRRRL